jgi:hypothetical protein
MADKRKNTKTSEPQKRSLIEKIGVANFVGYIIAFIIVLGYLIYSGRSLFQ